MAPQYDEVNYIAGALLICLLFAASLVAVGRMSRRDRREHAEWLFGSQLYKDINNAAGDAELRKELVKIALALL